MCVNRHQYHFKRCDSLRPDKAEEIYQQLLAAGVDVLLDDRGLRPGVAFADMELIGIPHRLILGERGLDNGVIEYKHRASGEADEFALDSVLEAIQQKLATP